MTINELKSVQHFSIGRPGYGTIAWTEPVDLHDADLAAWVKFGHNAKNNTGTFFMTIPEGGINYESVTCVLGYGMNWKFFDDEGNKIIQPDSL